MSNAQPLVIANLKPSLCPTLITDVAGLYKAEDFLKRVHVFGFDTETNITPTFVHRKLRTIQFGDRNEQYVIDLLPFAGSPAALASGQGWEKCATWAHPIIDVLRPALDSRDHVKVGANLQFDYEALKWCLGLRCWNFYDVQLAEKVIYAGRVNFFIEGFWALDDLVERYCKLKISKAEQKSFDLETPLTQSQIDYAALDTRLPLAVMAGQKAVIESAKLQRTVEVENNAIPAFGELHVNGLLLSREKWLANIDTTKEKHTENIAACDKQFIPIVGKKLAPVFDLVRLEKAWRDEEDREARADRRKEYQAACREIKAYEKASEKYEGEAAINYASTDQVLDALRKAGFGVKVLPNTNDKTLAKFSDKKIIQSIQDYRETKQLLKSFGENFLKHIDPDTGRVHAHHNQMGAETGRPSCVSPNVYNIPKDKRYRSSFIARPGYKYSTSDMSGAELRIMGDLFADPLWIEAFEKDWDLHSVGAEMAEPDKWASGCLNGCAFVTKKAKCKCPVHEKLRDDNKSTNFGVAYGMEEPALAAKLKISKEAAGKQLDRWRKVNSGVHHGLCGLGDKAKMTLAAHDMIGRRRLFDKPDWKKAAEIAIKREVEDSAKAGRPQRVVDSKMVGRVYYAMFGSIEREGKNMPIQGTQASIAKIAMGCGFDKDGKPFMWHLLPKYGSRLLNFVYDEFGTEGPEDKAEECSAMVRDCIIRAGAEVLTKVKMVSETHIGDCWTK